MKNQPDPKLIQVRKIIDTMLEASEHLRTLIKNKDLKNSIFIFGSIVQGFESIEIFLKTSKLDRGLKTRKNIEQNILYFAKELERGNITKLLEIMQFSLIPNIRKLKGNFDDDNKNRQFIIGVYLDHVNPIEVLPEARTLALIKEAKKRNAEIFFFSSNDVNLKEKQIYGMTKIDGKWQKKDFPLPDVINNVGVVTKGRQSSIERNLRKLIPFTTFAIGDKFYLVKKLVESGKYAHLLAPFKVVTDIDIVLKFLEHNDQAVFKPLRGARGENIYYLEKNGRKHTLYNHTKKKQLDIEALEKWVYDVILKRKNTYMIQKYINARTKSNEPFDIRAHVQKDGEGKWQITKIYPRIGNKKSILSNISRGGRTEDIESFFESQFDNKGSLYLKKLLQLSMDLTWHIDKLHGLALDELGLDLAIDNNGRFWLHEANIGPQTTYHEEERAVNTIGYALYLAKNKIFHTNEFEILNLPKDQFSIKTNDLDIAKLEHDITVGMLVGEEEINELTIACAYVANYENVNFFYFTPKDIDFNEGLIRGHFYIDHKWVPKIVKYPDVIYDRLRLRGVKGFDFIYQEFEGIPITNEFYGNSINKLEVYDRLKNTGVFDDIIIPYKKIERLKDIKNFIDNYNKIIIKPEVGSFANGVHLIEKLNTDKYKMALKEKVTFYNELELNRYVHNLIKKGEYIIQKYIESRTKENQPFDIRVHLVKDGKGKWSFAKIYPRIGFNYGTITITRKGGYVGNITGFLQRNFPDVETNILINRIKDLSIKLIVQFERLYEENLSEAGLDFAIDNKDASPYLIEINVNKPGIIYYEFEVARNLIQYSKYLALQNKKSGY